MDRILGVGSTWTFPRIAGLAGLGFAILIASTNAILVPAGLPHTGAATNDVVQFFTTRQNTVGLASALAPVAWVLATLFGAGAVSVLWRSDREQGTAWSLVGFAGVIMQNITFTGVLAIRLALASTTAQDSTAIAGLWALHNALFTFNGTFLALAMIGLSISGRRAGLIRRWHSGIGLLAAAPARLSRAESPGHRRPRSGRSPRPRRLAHLGRVDRRLRQHPDPPDSRCPSRQNRTTDPPLPLSHFDHSDGRPIHPKASIVGSP